MPALSAADIERAMALAATAPPLPPAAMAELSFLLSGAASSYPVPGRGGVRDNA